MNKTIGKSLPDGTYLEIHAEERDGSDGLSPGFSITGSGWEKQGSWNGRARARNGLDTDFGGCVHDLILKAAPHLRPLILAHLADPDGTPMHARANGWHFYSGKSREYEVRVYGQEYADRHGTDHERAARALHIAPADLPRGLSETEFNDFCSSLAATWEAHAEAARACLEAMIDGEGVEGR